METQQKAKFSLGRVVITSGAIEAISSAEETALPYLRRHACGDWGDLCQDDLDENNLSLKEGYRLLSAYRLQDLEKIWIITEADKSATTILLWADESNGRSRKIVCRSGDCDITESAFAMQTTSQ